MKQGTIIPPVKRVPCPACGMDGAQMIGCGDQEGAIAIQCFTGKYFGGCGHVGPGVEPGEGGNVFGDFNLADERWNEAAQHAPHPPAPSPGGDGGNGGDGGAARDG